MRRWKMKVRMMGRVSLGFFLAFEAERSARPVFFLTISRSARGSRMSFTEPMPARESLVGETVCDRWILGVCRSQ